MSTEAEIILKQFYFTCNHSITAGAHVQHERLSVCSVKTQWCHHCPCK